MTEPLLSRRRMLDALGRLGDELARRGVVGEINLIGGAVLVVEHELRESTRDLDAASVRPHQQVLEAAAVVAHEMGLPRGWLNEQAAMFAPRTADWRRSDVFDHPNLRLFVIEASQLLAMKALAGRPTDLEDLVFLIGEVGARTTDDVEQLVARHFPGEQLGERQRLVLDEAIDRAGTP